MSFRGRARTRCSSFDKPVLPAPVPQAQVSYGEGLRTNGDNFGISESESVRTTPVEVRLSFHKQFRRYTILSIAFCGFLFSLSPLTPVSAADKDVIAAGKQEFRHSCVLCHGLSARGESVMTTLNLLAIKPPDLRALQKRNKGTFPFWQTYQVIDGRQEITAHGSRDMPIWGDVFIRQEDGKIADDARAIGRILQLLYYLESIQDR